MTEIRLETTSAAALADEWDAYADQLEAHERQTRCDPESLRAQVGEIYEPYIQAKGVESAARAHSYGQAVASAREHARHLRAHKTGFEAADEDAARTINSVLDF